MFLSEELQEWLLVSVIHDCIAGLDGLYKSLLLGAVNDTEDLAASAMYFASGVWLNPLRESGDGFGRRFQRVRLLLPILL